MLCSKKLLNNDHLDLLPVVPASPLQDEFSLGKWDKSTVTGEGEDLIRPPDKGAEGQGGTIVLEVILFRA